MFAVAPRAGAWIEIPFFSQSYEAPKVAPRAGAWIEISISAQQTGKSTTSHPTRVCELEILILSVLKPKMTSLVTSRADAHIATSLISPQS